MKIIPVLVLSMFLGACGMRSIPMAKNEVESTLAEVNNQYKRRADLVPNLVKVVQAYASHEKETLEGVIQARAKATSVTLTANELNPEAVAKFQSAQGDLSRALGRLMMITENYPNLKADQNFRDLQAQLEGTENRITVARGRHIEAIKAFNNQVTVPPTSWYNSLFLKLDKLPQWNVSDEQERETLEKAPDVKL